MAPKEEQLTGIENIQESPFSPDLGANFKPKATTKRGQNTMTPMDMLLFQFDKLSLQKLQSKSGNTLPPDLMPNLHGVSIKSQHQQLLEVELKEFSDFIISRFGEVMEIKSKSASKAAGDNSNVACDGEMLLNNNNYEGQLLHLPSHEIEIVKIMLNAITADPDTIVGLEENEKHHTFSEMTGVAVDGDDDKKGLESFIATPVVNSEAKKTAEKREEMQTTTKPLQIQIPSSLEKWYEDEDWHRFNLEKAKREIDGLRRQEDKPGNADHWREFYKKSRDEWIAFRAESRRRMKECRSPRFNNQEVRLEKEWKNLKRSWNNAHPEALRVL
ncbi:hypothetical protein PVAG01_06732 [Phlyctema vagabunda]|uniref:Uncharacterized protein n=1 Tax=Phlyctema vagabunda TaxID=108571 RepID=A0ABR4PGX3_9HELO